MWVQPAEYFNDEAQNLPAPRNAAAANPATADLAMEGSSATDVSMLDIATEGNGLSYTHEVLSLPHSPQSHERERI